MSTKQTEKLTISGMSCGHCIKAVEEALTQIPGVTVQKVEIGSAEITYDQSQATRQTLIEAIEEAGYTIQ